MPILQHKDILQEGKVFAGLQAEIDSLKKSLKELVTVSKNVHSSGTGSEAKERLKLTKQLENATNKLAVAESEQAKELIKVKVAIQEKNRQQKQEATITSKAVGEYKRQSTLLNKLRNDYKNLAVQEKANTKEAKNLLTQITKLDTKLKKVDATVGQHQRNVGNYGSALKGVGRQLLGAAGIVGGVDLLIKGFTSLRERTLQLDKATRQIQNTFETTKARAQGLSATIIALANNFDEDYNEILQAANAVSKEFGISAEQSLALIEQGFRKGSNNSGEFLDILKEYPARLQSAPLSAEESFAIINEHVRDGVYSDKGIDAIKEAGISIRENTKAYRDAIAPINENVKAEIERERAAGNTFKAMQLIAGELKNVTQEQKQIILSDIFRGAGEDALTFVENLGELELNLKDVADQTSFVEEQQLKLSKVWNGFVGSVSDSESIFSKVWGTFIGLLAGALAELERFLDLIGLLDAKGKLNDATKATGKYKEEQKSANIETENGVKSQQNIGKEYQKNIAFLDSYVEKLEKQRRAEIALLAAEIERRKKLKEEGGATPEVSGFDAGGALNIDALIAQQEEAAKLEDERRKRELEKEIEQQQAILDIKKTFEDEAKAYAVNVASQIAEDKKNKDLNAIEAKKDALKAQLENGLINEIQYQTKLAELNKKQRQVEARAEKRQALYSLAIQGAVAFVTGLVRGTLLSAIKNASLVALKAAFVAATPIPKFAGGIERLKLGKNPKGKDTIPAMLDEGERIVPTSINDQLGNIPNEMLPQLVSKGLMFDKNFGLKKGQKDNFLLGAMMQGNKIKSDILTAISNLSSSYSANGVVKQTTARGEVFEHVDHSQDEFIKKLAKYLKQNI